MRTPRRYVPLIAISLLLVILLVGYVTPLNSGTRLQHAPDAYSQWDSFEGIENNSETEFLEIAPGDNLHKYSLAEQGWNAWNGVSSSLPVTAYGNRTDVFDGNQMTYFPTNGSTSQTSAPIPLGSGWEGHELFVGFNDLTENRTWTQEPELEDSPGNWTFGQTGSASASWLTDGHGSGDDCVQFYIPGDPSVGERAFMQQTMTVDRGDVVWAGFPSTTGLTLLGVRMALLQSI